MLVRDTATWRSIAATAVVAAGLAQLPATVAAAEESLTLTVNDARAEPGGLVAVVVRTYASRGLVQGEICLTASGEVKSASLGAGDGKVIGSRAGRQESGVALTKAGSMPFVALEAVEVVSDDGDAATLAAFDESIQVALVRFSSESGTVNTSDGPLAVFYFRLSSAFAGPAEFEIGLDLGGTFLIDADGEVVTIEPRPGRLEVRAPGEILRVEAMGYQADAGETAVLGVGAEEEFATTGGQVALAYDPAFAAGPPEVAIEPRDGQAIYVVDASEAGRVLVRFEAAGDTLGFGAGRFVSIRLPTSPDLEEGDKSAIVIDAQSTFLVDAAGRWMGLELRDAELEIY